MPSLREALAKAHPTLSDRELKTIMGSAHAWIKTHPTESVETWWHTWFQPR